MRLCVVSAVAAAALAAASAASDPALAAPLRPNNVAQPRPNDGRRTPAAGWNTWCTNSTCGHDVCTEDEVKSVASAMLSSGLVAAGYNRIDLDDCWLADARDASGHIAADPTRFPSGMVALGEWLHARGLLFGIYTSLGFTVCNLGGHPVHPPGSFGHEVSDAATFASWGVDLVKGDWCDAGGLDKDNVTSVMAAAAGHRSSGSAHASPSPMRADEALRPMSDERINNWRQK